MSQVRRAVDDRRVHDLALTADLRLQEGGQDPDHQVRRAAAEVAHQVGREVGSGLVLAHSEQGTGKGDVVHVVTRRTGQRPGLAPPRHPGVHQPRVACPALLRAEAEPLGGARTHPLDQHVGLRDQVEDDLDRGCALQVQRHAGTPAVEQVVGTAGHRLTAWPLHPDHVGTEIGEEHAGVRTGADAGQLDHLETSKWSRPLAQKQRHGADCGTWPPPTQKGPPTLPWGNAGGPTPRALPAFSQARRRR